MSDFYSLVRHKPLMGQVTVEVLDHCWFDSPVDQLQDNHRSRWHSHLADFFYVNDPNMTKSLLKSRTNYEGERRKFIDVVNLWTARNNAHRRIVGHSNSAEIRSFVALQLPHGILNLMIKVGLRDLVTIFPVSRQARRLRGWMALSHKLDPADEALISTNRDAPQEQVHFNPRWFGHCISVIQGNHLDDPEDLDCISREDLVSWLRVLQRHAAEGPQNLLRLANSSTPKVGYTMEKMIIAVVAGLLRADSQLRTSLRLSAQFCLLP